LDISCLKVQGKSSVFDTGDVVVGSQSSLPSNIRDDDLLHGDLNQESLDLIFIPFEPSFKPSMVQGNGKGWSRWSAIFLIKRGCSLFARHGVLLLANMSAHA